RSQINTTGGEDARVRERVRVRFGIDTMAHDNLMMSLGFATGQYPTGVPTSRNHTFAGFRQVPFSIDHVFLRYTGIDWATISLGKLRGHQLFQTSQLVWDSDINPEGVAVEFTVPGRLGRFSFWGNAAWYTLGELRHDQPANRHIGKPTIILAQPGFTYSRGRTRVRGAVAMQQFNIKGKEALMGGHPAFMMNLTGQDYTLINPSFDIRRRRAFGTNHTFTLHGDFVKNVDGSTAGNSATENDRQAYLLGARFGYESIRGFGQWNVGLSHSRYERNAIPRGMANSNAFSGMPHQGWQYTASVGLLSNLTFQLTYFNLVGLSGAGGGADFNGLRGVEQQVWHFNLLHRF
ncbi:MAG: putative porin, partial [Elusimicrobia bacterium]|nr:putative porin [Elusimicrobiota bacterium]